MRTIRRHETVQLATGGWVDLAGCEVLYFYRPSRLTGQSTFLFSDRRIAKRSEWPLLLRTPQGNYVARMVIDAGPFAPDIFTWRELSELEAYIWLQSQSRRQARRVFPELAKAQKEGRLIGGR